MRRHLAKVHSSQSKLANTGSKKIGTSSHIIPQDSARLNEGCTPRTGQGLADRSVAVDTGVLHHLYQCQIDYAVPKHNACWHTQSLQKVFPVLLLGCIGFLAHVGLLHNVCIHQNTSLPQMTMWRLQQSLGFTQLLLANALISFVRRVAQHKQKT